jgi:hypothetical protein
MTYLCLLKNVYRESNSQLITTDGRNCYSARTAFVSEWHCLSITMAHLRSCSLFSLILYGGAPHISGAHCKNVVCAQRLV